MGVHAAFSLLPVKSVIVGLLEDDDFPRYKSRCVFVHLEMSKKKRLCAIFHRLRSRSLFGSKKCA